MDVLQVAICGAVIGLSVNLFAGIWSDIRQFCQWINVHPASVLALGAVGGSIVVSVEFWLLVAIVSMLG